MLSSATSCMLAKATNLQLKSCTMREKKVKNERMSTEFLDAINRCKRLHDCDQMEGAPMPSPVRFEYGGTND